MEAINGTVFADLKKALLKKALRDP